MISPPPVVARCTERYELRSLSALLVISALFQSVFHWGNVLVYTRRQQLAVLPFRPFEVVDAAAPSGRAGVGPQWHGKVQGNACKGAMGRTSSAELSPAWMEADILGLARLPPIHIEVSRPQIF